MPDHDKRLRAQLIEMMNGGQAHLTFEDAVKDFPIEVAGARPSGVPHSAWELLEHLRLAQNDILRFSRSADYREMKWPEEYWPPTPAPPSPEAWQQSVESFQRDQAAFVELIQDQGRDLLERLPWGQGQSLLREAILVLDHNAYHIGQLVQVRKALERVGPST